MQDGNKYLTGYSVQVGFGLASDCSLPAASGVPTAAPSSATPSPDGGCDAISHGKCSMAFDILGAPNLATYAQRLGSPAAISAPRD